MSLSLLLCAPLVAACSSTSFTKTNTAPRPLAPHPREAVTMYTIGLPERPYAEVGVVTASSFNWTASTPSPLVALQDVAAARGCDGVIVMGPRDRIVLSGAEESASSGEARVATGAQIERHGNVEQYDGYRTIVRGTCIAYY